MESGRLDEMVAVVREVAAAGVGGLSDGGLTDELVVLRRLADAAEVAYLSRLREFDRRGVSESSAGVGTRAGVGA